MADAPPELWLARHGDTAWTVSRQHTGTTDLELNEAGIDAARALRSKLDGRRYDLVLSSPLRRALDTAHLAGFEPEVEPRLREFDYGEYEGVTTAQIHETRPDWDLWRDGSPGGETPGDVGRRMDEVIADIRDRTGERGPRLRPRACAARADGALARAPGGRGTPLPPGARGVGVLGSEHGAAAVRAGESDRAPFAARRAAGSAWAENVPREGMPMSTGLIIAIVVIVALVVLAAIMLMRPGMQRRAAERRMDERRSLAADRHRSEAEQREAQARSPSRRRAAPAPRPSCTSRARSCTRRGMADDALGDPDDTRFQRDRELLDDRDPAAAETRTDPTRARS